MLCNTGESKSIFVDVQNPCLQPPQGYFTSCQCRVIPRIASVLFHL